METRLQTIAMVLIVGFLTWVGTGLVDVKVGLAQVLSESVSLRSALDTQSRRLTRIENEVIDMNKEMSNYITRDEFREELRDLRDSHDKD
jgi:cell division protein FtsB